MQLLLTMYAREGKRQNLPVKSVKLERKSAYSLKQTIKIPFTASQPKCETQDEMIINSLFIFLLLSV